MENDTEDDYIACDYTGTCVAPRDARGITSCIYCGKELHQVKGLWYTWDAYMHKNPRPQEVE